MEASAAGHDLEELVGRLTASQSRTATFLRALVDAHTEAAALRALLKARADHVIEVSDELAGLLDFGEPALFRRDPEESVPVAAAVPA